MSREQEAHFTIAITRRGVCAWAWNVSWSPAAWFGRDGLVFPPLDHVGDGTSLSERFARAAASRAIRKWKQREDWEDESIREKVPA